MHKKVAKLDRDFCHHHRDGKLRGGDPLGVYDTLVAKTWDSRAEAFPATTRAGERQSKRSCSTLARVARGNRRVGVRRSRDEARDYKGLVRV